MQQRKFIEEASHEHTGSSQAVAETKTRLFGARERLLHLESAVERGDFAERPQFKMFSAVALATAVAGCASFWLWASIAVSKAIHLS